MLESGEERLVAPAGAFSISPDGRSVAYLESSPETGASALKVQPIDGAEARVVHTFERGHRLLGLLRWTSTGYLVYGRWIGDRETPTAFAISVNGGVPVEIDARVPGHPSLAIHPDGRRVAFEAGATRLEIWSLEGFLR